MKLAGARSQVTLPSAMNPQPALANSDCRLRVPPSAPARVLQRIRSFRLAGLVTSVRGQA
jgi:hypothetical protein